MDRKHREVLPNVVKDLPIGILSDGEGALGVATITKKTRKSKRSKIGKDGLYAGEELDIARWWIAKDMSSLACDSPDARADAVKATMLEQRARETQLQIILVLETLALEASADSLARHNPADDPLERGEILQKTQTKLKKPKKPQDMNTLLDLLADRLCIWQSMSIDEAKTSGADKKSVSGPGAKMTTGATPNDHLRQFCVDVVLPL